jgi:S1-C subfamily serine protease
MQKSTGDEDENKTLGVTVQEITEPFARASEMPDKNGVYVTGVRPSYPFNNAQPPILAGDVVLAIGGAPTFDLAAFKKIAAAQSSDSFVVTIRREDEQILSVVHITPDKKDPESKELPKAWLGIKTQVMVPDVSQAMHLPNVRGFRITQVYPYTEASKSGLKAGDVITAINKDKMVAFRAQDADDLKSLIDDLPIGEKQQITVIRDGKPLTLSVVMDKEPEPKDHALKVKQAEFEFAVREIMPLDRMEHEWTIDQKGVIVTDITQGGWSAVAGLEAEDVILAIGGMAVADIPGFESAMKLVFDKRPAVIQIFVKRGPITHYVFIEPEWTHIGAGK